MKKRKLKAFVLPTVYVMLGCLMLVSITFLGTNLTKKSGYKGKTSINAIQDDVIPVVSEVEEAKIIKPYIKENVAISKSYYDYMGDEKSQEKSLIFYENTYLQNSGILYQSNELFEVQTVLDGVVSNVDEDEILGNVVEITHNNNLKTIYYSLGEVDVKKNDEIVQGTIIGTSGLNRLDKGKTNSLLFEVYYNGMTLNPEEFYNMKIEDLK